MKKIFTISILLSICYLSVFSQGNWYKKSSYPGSARFAAIGFNIGTKGYMGTGTDNISVFSDFWEYDQSNDTWTQKAAYPITAAGAVSFVVGSKGYVGTGLDGTGNVKTFYEYDPSSNKWTKKADYHTAILLGHSFSIGNYGYFGTGTDGTAATKEFWAYDPANDTWTQKANATTVVRFDAASFAVNGKGYLGTGRDGTNILKDFWEYDPTTNKWKQKSDFVGGDRYGAATFVINGEAYMGTGLNATYQFYDWYKYDPSKDKWTTMAYFKGGPRFWAPTFSVGNYGFMGTGAFMYSGNPYPTSDFWMYDPLAPGFKKHPVDTLACLGSDFTLRVSGYGNNAQYKWQKNKSDITGYTTDSFLVLTSVTVNDTGYYRCIISNSHGTDTSFEAFLDITTLQATNILAQPQESTVCKGFATQISIHAKSKSKLYYQWYHDGNIIKGANDTFYKLTLSSATDTGYYQCHVINACESIPSDAVMVTYSPPPATPTITRDWNTLVSSKAAGYQWKKYNTDVSGATDQTFSPKSEGKFSVEISDKYGCKKLSSDILFNFSGLEELENGKLLNLYPNPSNDHLFVELNSSSNIEITIVNSIGKIVFEENEINGNNLKKKIDLSNFDQGIYFIQITGKNVNVSKQFMIQK